VIRILKQIAFLVVLVFISSAVLATGVQHQEADVLSPNAVQISFGPVAEIGPQVSPDGARIAFEYFSKDRPNVPQIWIMDRSRGFPSARPLVGNARYNAEFSWSPDGRWISYISRPLESHRVSNQIYKINVDDGRTFQITHFPNGTVLGDSTSWSSCHLIAFENHDDIYAVDPAGGPALKLVDIRSHQPSLTPSEIRWSPDCTQLSFTGTDKLPGSERSRIWLANLKDHTIQAVTESSHDGTSSWYDNDQVLFSRKISKGNLGLCLLCLSSGHVTCLTTGAIDLSPWGDKRTQVIFAARKSIKSSGKNEGNALLAGFHIWKFTLIN
jgi:Tol biopolymer transport system component